MKSCNLKAFLKHTSEEASEALKEMLLVLFHWRCVLAFICENTSTTGDDLGFNSCTIPLNKDSEYFNKF